MAHKVKRMANFGGTHDRNALARQFQRLCTRHNRCKFTQHRVHPRFEILERLGIDDSQAVFLCNFLHFVKRLEFHRITPGIAKTLHRKEIVAVSTRKPHGIRHFLDSRFAQAAFAFANELHKVWRSKPRQFGEFAP